MYYYNSYNIDCISHINVTVSQHLSQYFQKFDSFLMLNLHLQIAIYFNDYKQYIRILDLQIIRLKFAPSAIYITGCILSMVCTIYCMYMSITSTAKYSLCAGSFSLTVMTIGSIVGSCNFLWNQG